MKFKSLFLLVLVALAVTIFTFDATAADLVSGASGFDPASLLLLAGAPAAVPQSISDAINALGDDLKIHGQERREINVRLQAIEQAIAMRAVNGGDFNGAAEGVGAPAVAALGEDPVFAAASQAATRNQKLGALSCRVNLDQSIRAALTNEGAGSSDGSTYPTAPYRNPNISTGARRPLRLLDALPYRPIASDTFEYVQLNSTGDASEQDLEGDEKAEVDFDGVLLSGSIATIAAHTTASKQVLADAAGLRGAVDLVMGYKVLSRLEHQLINGTGGQGKIKGLMEHATPFVPHMTIRFPNRADRIGECIVAQRNNGYLPNLILLNPNDWFLLSVSKSEDGEYLFGSPTAPMGEVIWNGTVVASPSVPEGEGLTIDTRFTTVLDREQMSIMVSNTHKDYFTRNLVAILGEMRAGLEVTDARAVYQFDFDGEASSS